MHTPPSRDRDRARNTRAYNPVLQNALSEQISLGLRSTDGSRTKPPFPRWELSVNSPTSCAGFVATPRSHRVPTPVTRQVSGKPRDQHTSTVKPTRSATGTRQSPRELSIGVPSRCCAEQAQQVAAPSRGVCSSRENPLRRLEPYPRASRLFSRRSIRSCGKATSRGSCRGIAPLLRGLSTTSVPPTRTGWTKSTRGSRASTTATGSCRRCSTPMAPLRRTQRPPRRAREAARTEW